MALAIKKGILSLEQGSAPSSPSAGSRLIYPKSDGWYEKSSAGVESKVGPLTGTKVSALTAVTTPAGTDELPVNQAGTSKKLTLAQINTFCDPIATSSTAAQGPGFTADTYLVGSGLTYDPARLQASSFFRSVFTVTKTAAGTATATIILRMGTLGTTGDTGVLTLTFPSPQTAAADTMDVDVRINFRSVGAGTSAVVAGEAILRRSNTTTGFLSTAATTLTVIRATSAGFNSTTQTKIGLSVNGGLSAAWTTTAVQTELRKLL